MNIWLQNSVLIQPRTSPLKFDDLAGRKVRYRTFQLRSATRVPMMLASASGARRRRARSLATTSLCCFNSVDSSDQSYSSSFSIDTASRFVILQISDASHVPQVREKIQFLNRGGCAALRTGPGRGLRGHEELHLCAFSDTHSLQSDT